ncbi:hypothetical protein T484DRAFT_1963469 [Baffinella frigidus]|nr:hypothetical protein T484DRAFT_1963469 [Cryptophyta sp. CCMP2293]
MLPPPRAPVSSIAPSSILHPPATAAPASLTRICVASTPGRAPACPRTPELPHSSTRRLFSRALE